MKWRVLTTALFGATLGLFAASSLRGQVVAYTWTGASPYGDSWDYSADFANWAGGIIPLNDDVNTQVFFGSNRHTNVSFNTESSVVVNQLTISGNKLGYYFDGSSYNNLTIGSGGLVYSPALPVRSTLYFDSGIYLTASQTWNVASGTLTFDSDISDNLSSYPITKTGAGTLVLGSPSSNSWTGGLILTAGRVIIGPADGPTNSLGSGTLTFNGGTLVADDIFLDGYSSVNLDNNIVSNGLISTENHLELGLYGQVTLAANTTVSSKGSLLYLGNGISGSGMSLTIAGPGNVFLDPTASSSTNTYTGGTNVTGGALIFADQYAVPGTGAISIGANGYAGYGSTVALQTGFLDKLNRAAVLGTIGFDTLPSYGVPNTFIDPIDLTGVAASAKLGSATSAILSSTAVITPQGTDYRFGGGGGVLQVDSLLTGTRALVVDSPAARPLTLLVTNPANDYSGGTSVTNSGVIFGSSNSSANLPAGSGGITINAGGYVGFRYWGDYSDNVLIPTSLAKITSSSVGMVGFDQVNALSVPIDLSGFTGALYLGTATGLQLTGTITPAGGASAPYRFAGYKGGWLEVASNLTGSAGIMIGDPASSGTFGDNLNSIYSTVTLSGNNSGLTGNVTLYGGQLMVGQSNGVIGTDPTNALGTGSLVVAGMPLPPEWVDDTGNTPLPQLDTTWSGLILPNDISLGTTLQIGNSGRYFQMKGQITGSGGLYLKDNAYLALANDTNSFSGGISFDGYYDELHIDANHATGTGPLSFGNNTEGDVYLDTLAPVIGGLNSRDFYSYSYIYATQTNTVLTINQSTDGIFYGEFDSDATYPNDNFRIVKSGTGSLRFDYGGMYFYNGTVEPSLPLTPQVSLQVNQGTVVVGPFFYIESTTPSIWIHGGTLALDGAAVYNPIIVDSGGRLAGNGSFSSAVNIGTGATIAPGLAGLAEVGALQFTALNLAGGGAFEWNIQDTTQQPGTGWDSITVSASANLDLSSILLTDPADSAHRFTLKVISLQPDGTPGLLSGFDPSQPYSWTIFSFTNLNAYDPNKFLIDTAQFANSLAFGPQGNGWFSLSLGSGQLFLNFTPVPEPSTYALMLLGLAGVALPMIRRRRS